MTFQRRGRRASELLLDEVVHFDDSFIGDETLADDLCQETLLQALRNATGEGLRVELKRAIAACESAR